MRVEELMTRAVVTARPETPLKEVGALLVDHRISGVPVVDAAGTVVGVVSKSDLIVREDVDRRRAKSAAVTAADAMTSPAVTIEPGASVVAAARELIDRRIDRLPVVHEGLLIGIVTRTDLVRAFVRSDSAIEHEIRDDVLVRGLWLAPENLTVVVREGHVAIGGRVDTRSDAELVAACVRRVAGVLDVDVSQLEWRYDDAHHKLELRMGRRI